MNFLLGTSFTNWLTRSLATAGLILAAGCSDTTQQTTPQDAAIDVEADVPALTAITLASQTTYFEDHKGADGFEYRLLEKFSHKYGYDLNLIVAETEADIYAALEAGHADLAMLGYPIPPKRQEQFLRSPSLIDITTQLIYRRGEKRPQSFEDLIGKNIVVRDLEQYREKYLFLKQHYPELEWKFVNDPLEKLVEQTHKGLIDYTLVDSHRYVQLRARYTRTRVAFDIYYPEPISWLLPNDSNEEIVQVVEQFFDEIKEDGTLNHLNERFFGHADDANPVGSLTFFRRVDQRLPRYQDLIEQIAHQYKIDWRLLAAIAYQESHWNPRARSQTGVRGMMMLTLATAKDLGIENRLDAASSLRGGARYFRKMHRRLPESIKEPDRSWFALAAYNVGLGHLLDARKITEFHGADPNRWADVKRYLPLLEKEHWHQFTRHGYARGREPVSYVQNIRHFTDLLEWRFPLTDAEQAALRSNNSKPAASQPNINIETYEQEVIQKTDNEPNPISSASSPKKLT